MGRIPAYFILASLSSEFKAMQTAELRAAFLQFFESKGHRILPSGSLVPINDPTLLFTNAGMNQFKDPLLGKIDLGYYRATTAQRCVRAGGKHNDLENVGFTARHHTFFEMMGNFSFGDYFKTETIGWAWEFSTQVLGLDKDRIYVTVHPTDEESRQIWANEIGVPMDRIIDIEDNFWTMGDTGPCGPCTELFYDHGEAVEGGPPGSPEEDGDRYIEFWNLVFPQFDRSADGELVPLPKPGVDTGMGLERMAAILQGVHSNYEIDLFRNLMMAAGGFAGITEEAEVLKTASLRVIADHIRSGAFLIADGVLPGNEDRQYVLRRIIRRALRHGYKLDIKEPFFHKLVPTLVAEMGEAYPLLAEKEAAIIAALAAEEERFGETLKQGMSLLKTELDQVKGAVLPGEVAFKLYDTYGFPVDLTADIAREAGSEVDQAGFDQAMDTQRARGRAATSFSTSLGQKITVSGPVDFTGYSDLAGASKVLALFDEDGDEIEQLNSGQNGVVVLAQTPFYAESGGQIGDSGMLVAATGQFSVNDTQLSGEQHIHVGTLTAGMLSPGDRVEAKVTTDKRTAIRRNHSATHLIHAALRSVLGDHVEQKGSLVNDQKLRFDFSHGAAVTSAQLRAIEAMVNAEILKNTSVQTELLDYEAAVEKGAMALFGEKYGDEVRVLTMGDGYSVELCGGTHVARTGDIGLVKIQTETGIAAGVRRIEAVSGEGALEFVRSEEALIADVGEQLKVPGAELAQRVQQLLAENRQLNKQVRDMSAKLAAAGSADLTDQAVQINQVSLVAAQVEGGQQDMMQMLDNLRSKQPDNGIWVLTQVENGKVGLVIAVSKNLLGQINAKDLIGEIGPIVGAKGGGRPDMARAGGGTQPEAMAAAFAAAKSSVEAVFGSA